jgi:hypothetical protein
MSDCDADPAPSEPVTFVTPGRPVTFVADGCQIVVDRDAHRFDIALAGSLILTNRRAVAEVLEAVIANAEAVHLSLRRLDVVDEAGATMFNDIANRASRARVIWNVVDGSLLGQAALERVATDSEDPAPHTGRRPTPVGTPARRRLGRRIVPST